MISTTTIRNYSIHWGIYHQEREFAREVGDPCLGVIRARTKCEAENEARRQGIVGPTGIWAHPLPETKSQGTSACPEPSDR